MYVCQMKQVLCLHIKKIESGLKSAKWSCKLFQGWIEGGEKSGGVTRQK